MNPMKLGDRLADHARPMAEIIDEIRVMKAEVDKAKKKQENEEAQ